MQVLTLSEIDQVSGGAPSIAALAGQIAQVIHEGGAAGFLLGASFFAGYGIGLGFNAAFQSAMGQSLGSWLYDVTH